MEDVLCGFVWCHGKKDFSVWEIDLDPADRLLIETVLKKYETKGSSVRNAWDSKISDIFWNEY